MNDQMKQRLAELADVLDSSRMAWRERELAATVLRAVAELGEAADGLVYGDYAGMVFDDEAKCWVCLYCGIERGTEHRTTCPIRLTRDALAKLDEVTL